MTYRDRLARIIARARWAYRAHHAMRGSLAVAIVIATLAFLGLLAAGLGFLDAGIWRQAAPFAAVALGLGALLGSLRPLEDAAVLARLDSDYGLQNALSTVRELLVGSGAPALAMAAGPAPAQAPAPAPAPAPALAPMAEAHVRAALGRAEALGLARTVTADLGARARILGILCLCIASVALI